MFNNCQINLLKNTELTDMVNNIIVMKLERESKLKGYIQLQILLITNQVDMRMEAIKE